MSSLCKLDSGASILSCGELVVDLQASIGELIY
jgi:hypothetical protein